MTPYHFPEANVPMGPPPGMTEEQVRTIPAFKSSIQGGSMDGMPVVVTAWQPTPEELEQLKNGAAVYLSVIGGLPPHFLTTSFEDAIRLS